MFAEIITIGDEILIGQIIDTNSAFIAQELNKIGVSVVQITSIQDDKTHILKSLKDAESRADIVLITGGLGPTKDDVTKNTLCEYFSDHLVEDESVLQHIENIFKKYSIAPLLQVNKNQALVPSKAQVLPNEFGTAPGIWLKNNQTVFISMPGVPFEMKHLMHNQVIPKIQKEFDRTFILHKTIITYGMGESALAQKIEDWEDNLPKDIKLAYLPSLGKVRLRLSTKGKNLDYLEEQIQSQTQKLYSLITDIVHTEDDGQSIEEIIAKLLTQKGMTLATAESFTGGKIAELITQMPGASAYFKGTIVSYATEAKINVLQVPKAVIENQSVVSAAVAEIMAQNVRKLMKTDFSIGTTGNAGPTKGDSKEEIGTVFIAIASEKGVISEKFSMGAQRERVVQKSVYKAFEMLQKEILKF
jgi:nicotinamide-nucleotide amidase